MGGGKGLLSRVVSRAGASDLADCLSEYNQLTAGAYLSFASSTATTVTPGMATFADCVSLCSAQDSCAAVTFDSSNQTCTAMAAQPAGQKEALNTTARLVHIWVWGRAHMSGEGSASSISQPNCEYLSVGMHVCSTPAV